MPNLRKYKIGVISSIPTVINNRISFLKALAEKGNEVWVYNIFTSKEEILKKEHDFLLVFCLDYQRIHLEGMDNILSLFPYITIWDVNPLRCVGTFLKKHRENHIGIFVIDSKIVDDLKSFGFNQAVYFPYFYTDINVFKPLQPKDIYTCDVSFAGTYTPPQFIPYAGLNGKPACGIWTDKMYNTKEEFRKEREHAKKYIDVFTWLKEKINPETMEFYEMSVHLMYLQKWIERMELFKTLSDAKINLHVFGGYKTHYGAKNMNHLLNISSPYIHIHDFIDKHTELPFLYNSSKINLCCTQFPKACHERVYQASACGAFILHEEKGDVPDLFEPEKEIILYKNLDELPYLIEYYLKNEEKRKKIAENARKRFLSEHTPLHRAETLMKIMDERIEIYKSKFGENKINKINQNKKNYYITSEIENMLKKGVLLFKERKVDDALSIFFNVLSYDKNEVNALKNIGIIYYLEKEDYSQAKKFFEKVISIKEDKDVYYFLGDIYNKENDFEKSIFFHKKSILLSHPYTNEYKEIKTNCTLCNSDNYEIIWVGDQSKILSGYGVINPLRIWVRCRVCNFIFANPRPIDECLNKWWEIFENTKKTEKDWKFLKDDASLTFYIQIFIPRIKTIEKYLTVSKILDIGASVGIFLAVCKERGWKTKGIELTKKAAEIAKSTGSDIIYGDFLKVELNGEKFDAVTLWDLIEHISSPQKTLLKVREFIKDGGILALSTPNPESAFVKFKRKSWHLWSEPTHIHYFTLDTIKKLLLDTGFEFLEYNQVYLNPSSMEIYARKI